MKTVYSLILIHSIKTACFLSYWSQFYHQKQSSLPGHGRLDPWVSCGLGGSLSFFPLVLLCPMSIGSGLSVWRPRQTANDIWPFMAENKIETSLLEGLHNVEITYFPLTFSSAETLQGSCWFIKYRSVCPHKEVVISILLRRATITWLILASPFCFWAMDEKLNDGSCSEVIPAFATTSAFTASACKCGCKKCSEICFLSVNWCWL